MDYMVLVARGKPEDGVCPASIHREREGLVIASSYRRSCDWTGDADHEEGVGLYSVDSSYLFKKSALHLL